MKITINNVEYTEISDLRFAPEADLLNNSLPIPEYECKIYTNNTISYGQWAILEDDLYNLYARYWLKFAEIIGRDDDRQTKIWRIVATSPLIILDRIRMSAVMYNTTADICIGHILDRLGDYGQDGEIIEDSWIDDDIKDVEIVGFAPEQTARERLLWILTAAGGYCLSAFWTTVHINKIPIGEQDADTVIPIEHTFWRPSISFRDYVTKVSVTGYTFTSGTPASTDKYVTDGTNYWIVSKQVITVTNTSLPSGVPENEVVIDGVTLLSPTRASALATLLTNYYFNRVEIDADVINNQGDYKPGDSIMVHTDEDVIYGGYIDRCDFTFGVQARSKLHLIGTYGVDVAILTLSYMWGTVRVGKRKYFLPKNTPYSISTEYLDCSFSGHRYIFRPTVATVSGTLTQNTTQNVSVEIALDGYREDTGERAALDAQYAEMMDFIQNAYNKDRQAIQRAYRGQQRKLLQYLNNLETAYIEETKNIENAFEKMKSEVPINAAILYIESVDEVDYEDEQVYDPDDRTVVIE